MKASWICALFLVCLNQPAHAATSIDDAQLAIKNHDFAGAETQLKNLIKSNPANIEAQFWLAKVLAYQGHFEESSQQYQQLLAKEPNNSDYQLGQAQVLVWSGKPKEALPIIDSAQRLSPNDADISRLRTQAQLAIADAEALNTAAPVLDALDRDFLNKHRNQVEAGFGYDSYSKNRGNGRSEYLSFEHRFAPRKLIYGTLQESEKFNKNDLQLLVGGYYPLPSSMTLNVEAAISGTHKIVPKNTEMASVQIPLSKAWFLTGGLRHSQYTASHSYQEFGVLEWYFSDYRLAYTLTATQALGETSFGNRASLSRYYNDISYITLTVGAGREVERDLGSEIIFNTANIGVNGRHWFNKDWALAWSLGATRQDTAYTRTGGSLGIRYAF